MKTGNILYKRQHIIQQNNEETTDEYIAETIEENNIRNISIFLIDDAKFTY